MASSIGLQGALALHHRAPALLWLAACVRLWWRDYGAVNEDRAASLLFSLLTNLIPDPPSHHLEKEL
jgi:hypothetical protein